ncbi:MAG: dipeptidase PepV [Acholeplasmataceae bacterium]|nr:MAG: dipeptidase PepV [Acholeplasmataceae bacterium]
MTISFKQEVLKRKDQLIDDLQNLVRINSELTTFDPKRKGAPFGEGIRKAHDFMLGLGRRDGFETVDLDGYAGHIEHGDQKPFIGMIGHLDVVPAGNGWTHDPYGAEIHENRMYGRGTEDDKGPTIAAYYALKILKELDVPLSKRIKLIIGNDEETAWRCMRHYFSIYPEAPEAGFIPDADFPLIYAEKGISRLLVEGTVEAGDIINIKGGFRDNMVPDYAEATLKKTKDYQGLFAIFLNENHFQGSTVADEDVITVKINGKSAHGSTPEHGENAIDRLFAFFQYAGMDNTLIRLYDGLLLGDHHGQKLGVDHTDKEMGELTNNVGVIRLEEGRYQIHLNLRYPNGVDFDATVKTIQTNMNAYEASVKVDHHQKLLYKDPDSPLVKTLLGVYRKHTGDKSRPITIGGGTFARAMPNCVAFGPHFLNKPTFIHQKNEFIDLDDLMLATIIYTEALYELAK